MKTFSIILKNEIRKGLPGTEVQLQMAPTDRIFHDFPKVPRSDTGIAAVLILLYPAAGSVHTVFLQRPDYNGVHSGQISFPGGRKDPSDTGIIETALREANEEIGIDQSKISVIGTLTPLFIPVSNILVTPVLGWIDEKPEFKPHAEEVVFLIEGDLRRFLDPLLVKTGSFEIRGEMRDLRYFDYEGYVIWGATAMMLNELLTILRRIRNLDLF